MPNVRTWLSMAALVVFAATGWGQNNGLTPTADRGRLLPSKALRKSIGTLKLLITDATSEVKYWNKDTVFTNFWKINVDSLINNYNDTTNKSGTPCVDSLWKVANLIYHRDNNCGVQSVSIAPLCTDSVWKISTTIYHRSITCDVEFWDSGEGCSGGDVYYTASLGDTLGLDPAPECGDVLVVTQDTCRKYVYSRGATPVKWNFVGAFLDNENCFDFPVCVDSFWRAGNLIYHRNIDCIVQSVVDSNTAATGRLHKNVGGGNWIVRMSDTDVDANREFKSIIAGTRVTIDTTATAITINATGDTVLHKNTGVGVGKIVKADNVSSDDNRKFKSILKGSGIDVTNLTDEIQIVALVDTVDHQNIGTGYEVVAEGTIANSADYNRKFRSIKGDGTVAVAYGGVVQNTYQPEIILGVDTTASVFNKFNYDMANVGSGREVYKNKTGSDPTVFNLRTLLGAGSTKVTQGTNEITIQDTASSKLNTVGLTGGGGIGYFKTSLSPEPGSGSIRLSAGNNTKITQTTDGLDGVYIIEALPTADSLWTATSNSTTFNFNHRPDQTSDITLKAGVGVYFDDFATGVTGKTRINVDTTNAIFNAYNYAMANVGAGAGVWKNTTGSDPTTFNLKSLVAGTGITITANTNDITIANTVPTTARDSFWTHSVSSSAIVSRHSNIAGNTTAQTLTAGERIVFSSGSTGANGGTTIDFNGVEINATPLLAVEQAILSGNGKTATPLTVSNCGVDYPNATALARYVMIQPNGPYNCLVKCPTEIDCTAQLNSIDDGSKLASVQDPNDMNGLITAMIDVINRQGQRISQLETPQTFASAGAVNVSARLYDQQATIAKQNADLRSQAKLIEDLTARLDRLDRLQASK